MRALDGFGRDLTVWRKLRHLTAEQVADRAGVSRSTVLRLEGGQGASLENLLRVARAYESARGPHVWPDLPR